MIGFILGFFVGGFFGVATVSCLVAAHKGDMQGKPHSDDYAQGFEDGYAEGLNDARWKGESDGRSDKQTGRD